MLHLDHIVPIVKGGLDTADNIVTSCKACNSSKGKRTMKDANVVTNAKGRRMAKGLCPECGTKMNLFLKAEK